jgi:hypothetical protein
MLIAGNAKEFERLTALWPMAHPERCDSRLLLCRSYNLSDLTTQQLQKL